MGQSSRCSSFPSAHSLQACCKRPNGFLPLLYHHLQVACSNISTISGIPRTQLKSPRGIYIDHQEFLTVASYQTDSSYLHTEKLSLYTSTTGSDRTRYTHTYLMQPSWMSHTSFTPSWRMTTPPSCPAEWQASPTSCIRQHPHLSQPLFSR